MKIGEKYIIEKSRRGLNHIIQSLQKFGNPDPEVSENFNRVIGIRQ